MLAEELAPLGVETHLLALRRTGTPRAEGAAEPDPASATVVDCPDVELPGQLEALFKKDGGFARTVIDHPSQAEAVRHGLRLVENLRPDLILSSIPPRRVGEVAWRVASETGLPWVIDWQDPIALRPLNVWPSRGYYAAYAEREALWVERAALHIVTAPSHERLLTEQRPGARVATVPIGLPAPGAGGGQPERPPPPERGRLLYSGSLTPDLYGFARRFPWKLSMRLRSGLTLGRLCHAPFAGEVDYRPWGLAALEAIARRRGAASSLEFAGARHAGVAMAHARRLGLGQLVRVSPWAGRDRAAADLARAHVLWLCCAGTSARGGEPVLLSKAAGYLASGRPIFAALPPECDTAELLRGHAGVFMVDPTDPDALDDALDNALAGALARALETAPDAGFDRDVGHLRSDRLAERLVGLLADVESDAPGGGPAADKSAGKGEPRGA
jgi:hypothetical protein